MLRKFFLVLALAFASSAWAGVRTVTPSLPSMYCEMCPATVKKALSKVPGVSKIDASYEQKQVLVTFDDAKTSVEALQKATANAGYPSTLKK